MKRNALVTAGLCAVALALAQAGFRPASAHATQRSALATTTIKVTLHNSHFVLSANSATRGVVIFKVHNAASFRHDFSINGRTTRLLTTGQSAILRVTFLRGGRYPWRCTFGPGASWGEKGVFTIY